MAREYSEKELGWLWLNTVLGTSVKLTERLVVLNGGASAVYEKARKGEPLSLPEAVTPRQKAALMKRFREGELASFTDSLERGGFHAVTRDSEDYPRLLREIYDPPTVLYVKGRLHADTALPIAVIGSRKCSDYGREAAMHFGFELAEHGACVISGMALGCDASAAIGALRSRSSEYPTLAVLGSGIDVIYPQSNKRLYDMIAERGAVITEMRPGLRPTRESFPQRNRIISGLSKGILVVEAAAKSGTRITVDFAHEQGRDVFAVPGRITDPLSAGTNLMIKNGEAKAVFGVDDVLYEYGIFLAEPPSPIHNADISGLDANERKLFELLKTGEKTVDALCEISGLDAAEINICLTEMELSGIIRQLPNGLYSV